MRTNRNLIEYDKDSVRRYPRKHFDLADLAAIAERHEAARTLGLPVPRVLARHPDHLVLERMPGTPLLETPLGAGAQQRLGRQLAEVLRVLRETTEWAPPSADWATLWNELAAAAPTPETERAARVAASIVTTAVHGDLSGGNLLVRPDGTLTAVLDWDGAALADPAQDFSALCANVPPVVAEALRAATAQAEELSRRADVYLATWPLQNRLWREGRHPCLNRLLAEGSS